MRALALLIAAMCSTAATASAATPGPPPDPVAVAPVPLPIARPWPVLRVDDVPAAAVLGPWLDGWADGAALNGTASVELQVNLGLPRIGWAAQIDVPELKVGDVLLGAVRLRIASVASEASTMVRLDTEGPLGQVQVQARWPSGAPVDRLGRWGEALAGLAVGGPSAPAVDGDDPAAGLAASSPRPDGPAPVVRIRFEALDLDRLTDLVPRLAARGLGRGFLRLDATGLFGELVATDAAWRGGPLGTVEARLQLTPDALRGALRFGHGATRVSGTADIPVAFAPATLDLRWLDDRPLAIAVEGRALDPTGVAAFNRFHPAAQFVADATLSVTGSLDALQLTGRLDGAMQDGALERRLSATVTAEPKAQTLTVALDDVLRFEARTQADLVAVRRADAPLGDAAVEGRLVTATPLSTLMPYLPAAIHEPTGVLDGELAIAGTLADPRFDGRFGVQRGALTVVAANTRIVDLDLAVAVEGDRARVERCAGRSGRGTVNLTGGSSWTITPDGHDGPLWSAWRTESAFELVVVDVPLVQPGLPAGLLDARVSAEGRATPDEAEIAVRVDETRLDLTGYALPEARPIARNRAVRRHDWRGTVRRAELWLAGDGVLDLRLSVPAPIVIEGADTAVRLAGDIRLRREDDVFVTEGALTTLDGHFTLFDNPFTLTGGRLAVQGGAIEPAAAVGVAVGQARLVGRDTPKAEPLDTLIDIAAEGRVVDTDVFVRIHGPSRRPTLVLESEPALPQYQILTLLITGRVDAIDERNGRVRRQAARLIDRFHNPSLARQLYDRIGVDKLGLGFGASVGNPILTVGKQINRRLYVETVYHHDAPPDENEKEARVEYRLSRRWTVDTTAGDAGEGTVGLFWQTGFGRPEAPEEPEAPEAPKASEAPEAPEAPDGEEADADAADDEDDGA